MYSRIGNIEVAYSARGVPTYRVELWHEGLKKHRLIKSADAEVARRKAELQMSEWNQKWFTIENRERDRSSKEGVRLQIEGNKKEAADRTVEARRELVRLGQLLKETLEVNDAVDWEKLKDRSEFAEPKPVLAKPPKVSPLSNLPKEPQADAPVFQARVRLLDRLVPGRKQRILAECRAYFETAHREWKESIERLDAAYAQEVARYEDAVRRANAEYEAALLEWNGRRNLFLAKQQAQHEAIDKHREAYLAGSPEAIAEYFDLVLSQSSYPDYFPQEFTLDYNPTNRVLIVDYWLPSPDSLPTVSEVKYVQSRDEYVTQKLTEAKAEKLYDDVLYQVTLRTVHELYEADVINTLSTVVFNGIVKATDKRTGQEVTACVLSLQTARDEFMSINLANVEPKACFKSLKGVGSSKLHSLTPVAPLLQMQREDVRFVTPYAVADQMDEGFNLASMDWGDFEHLIREIFEQEFASAGGEVKVTRASRDGGVDAVAFDPDPIRGGKIVIQAKRYLGTVGVAAVRDLYGTVMNEGANKGILVTTSDYGPDAYRFANGKPLTLLNGANLLHMLEKHGHKARIDVHEARRESGRGQQV